MDHNLQALRHLHRHRVSTGRCSSQQQAMGTATEDIHQEGLGCSSPQSQHFPSPRFIHNILKSLSGHLDETGGTGL